MIELEFQYSVLFESLQVVSTVKLLINAHGVYLYNGVVASGVQQKPAFIGDLAFIRVILQKYSIKQ